MIDGDDYVQEIASKLEIFHRFFSPLVNFFSTQIGNFLGTEYIFAGTMGEMLKNLWVISRNLVNIFFVGALLWVALKAVAGDFFGEETDVKKELLKIAVFLVAVNFSWLATKVVLDAANVGTNIAFSLPSGVSNIQEVDLGECEIDGTTGRVKGACKLSEYHFSAGATGVDQIEDWTEEDCKTQNVAAAYEDLYPASLNGNLNPNADPDNVNDFGDKTVLCWGKLDLFDYNQNTSVIYLTYGMAKIQNLGGSYSYTGSLSQMAIASIFSLLIQVTFTVALLALFILMLIRAALLWLFVGFSPVLVAMLYLGGGEGPVANFGPKDFIKWAFIPVQVGIILSVGFIMIAAGQANSDILSNLNQNVNIEGGFYNAVAIFSGMESTQGIIWLIIVELIFAIAVYGPMKELPFAGTIIGPIADFAKNTLTSLAKTPLIAPIIPVGDTDGDGEVDKVSFRDLAQSFNAKINWRQGLSADAKTIRKLEHDASQLAQYLKSRKSEKDQIVRDAQSGKINVTLKTKLDLSKLKGLDEDIQQDILEKAGFDPTQTDHIVKALKGSSISAATSSTPTSSTTSSTPAGSGTSASGTTPVPAPGTSNLAQMQTQANTFAGKTNAATLRTNTMRDIRSGKLDELKKIFPDLKAFNDNINSTEKEGLLTKAGFNPGEIPTIISEVDKAGKAGTL